MRLWCSVAVCTLLVACGDNIHSPTDGNTIDSAIDGAVDGAMSVCGDGVLTGAEQCETGSCCTSCSFTPFGTQCRAAAGECDAVEVCDQLSADCPADVAKPDGTPCTAGFCQAGACVACDTSIDADFDGSNQCLDCDDNNALAYPSANERACDGVDDDCDGKIDEDYDADLDTYSTCSTDPMLFDCDDTRPEIHPGATELCGAGSGNGRDDNCNGYTDETCTPCNPVDGDGDGVSECQGDCDDTQMSVSPNQAEACDGVDTDCNTYTTANCDVSDPCNFVGDADVCKDDLECGCVVGAGGACTGDYRCASFCEGSYTGAIGAGCTATQSCRYRWTLSDNQHACAETTAALGNLLAGAACTADTECRSGVCDKLCVGPGCQTKRCVDFCDHHAPDGAGSCATGTVCTILSSLAPSPAMYASCALDNSGTRTTGESCTGGCLWGTQSCVANVCAQPCGDDDQCPSGYHCSLLGNRVTTGVWTGAPPGVDGQTAIETVPVCLADSGTGAHDRPGGAACTANADCVSQFCEATLHVCVDPCVTDASCAVGLTCEPIYLRPGPAIGITWGRACINGSFGELVESM